jgi:hypothetical protein
LDKTRFAQFLVDYRNGLLPGLNTVDKVQSRAECYVTLQSQQADKPAQIFICSETRKPAGKSSKQNKKTGNSCGTVARMVVVIPILPQRMTTIMGITRRKEVARDRQLITAVIHAALLITLLVIAPMKKILVISK